MILVEQGRVDKAISHMELIAGEIPFEEEMTSVDQLVSAMITVRHADKAEQWLRRRVEKDPQSPFNYRLLFRTHKATNAIDKCKSVLDEWELISGAKDLEMRAALEQTGGQ
jgi:Tfp pilus assembly protein PilF